MPTFTIPHPVIPPAVLGHSCRCCIPPCGSDPSHPWPLALYATITSTLLGLSGAVVEMTWDAPYHGIGAGPGGWHGALPALPCGPCTYATLFVDASCTLWGRFRSVVPGTADYTSYGSGPAPGDPCTSIVWRDPAAGGVSIGWGVSRPIDKTLYLYGSCGSGTGDLGSVRITE